MHLATRACDDPVQRRLSATAAYVHGSSKWMLDNLFMCRVFIADGKIVETSRVRNGC